ncbi:hypothetical protein ACGFYZ_01950 [Streptomyces sp. NPDC048330]|uniref:hypothetical protein n=1 Tax=Streptomyces sp. NPDC048330 TaxID=3365533 RepID=UPI00371904B3
MSASDQDTPVAKAPAATQTDEAPATGETGELDAADALDGPAADGEPTGRPGEDDGESADEDDDEDDDEEDGAYEGDDDEDPEDEDDEGSGAGLTPKQARRLRVAAASVLLVALAVVLVVRLASRTSVLVVGVYGLAMILCGVVIELSRNGRTRLATWLLVGGLAAALAFDWLILP